MPAGRHAAFMLEASEGIRRDPEMESLFSRAMAGRLPRGRPLKEWEPQKLRPRHLQMVMLKACGVQQNRIAEITDIDPGRVSIVLNHPDAQHLLSKILARAADQAVDMETRIKALAPEALDVAADVMRDPEEKGNTRQKVAFGIIDRAGYGSVEKKEVKHSVDVPKEQFDDLSAAIREAQDIEDAEWAVVAEQEEGSEEVLEQSSSGDDEVEEDDEVPSTPHGSPGLPGVSSSLPPAGGSHE